MKVFHTATIYKNWNEARKDARQKNGPVIGWMESAGDEAGYFFPIACGTRTGVVTGRLKSAQEMVDMLFT